MLPHDKRLALSAVEVELLRDVRSRLTRRAVSEKARFALGAAFLQACERVGVRPASGPAGERSPADLVRSAAAADMAELSRLAGALKMLRERTPQNWPAAVAAGAPQAVLSRRLALAGREPAIDPESLV